MRIAGFTQWWRPEPADLPTSLMESLAEVGHQVEVVTGFPNYPTGNLYAGYRIVPRLIEQQGGIRVVRTALIPSHDNSGFRRATNYVSFALSSSLLGVPSIVRPDVAYVYHPPVTAAWGARLLRRLRGVPFVLHVQDLWPDAVTASGMLNASCGLRIAARALESMVARTYASAAHIVVISEGFRHRLVERGVPEAKVTVVPNWSPTVIDPSAPADPSYRAQLGPPEARILLFAGNVGPFQNLELVIAQFSRLPEASRLHLTILGDGISRSGLEQMVRESGSTRVSFLPRCAPSEAVKYQMAADVLLVPLATDGFLESTIPSKLATALSLGQPVMLPAEGDAAEMVRTAGAGLTCDPDEHSLGVALREINELADSELRVFGESGRRYYERHLSLRHAVSSFESVFASVVNP